MVDSVNAPNQRDEVEEIAKIIANLFPAFAYTSNGTPVRCKDQAALAAQALLAAGYRLLPAGMTAEKLRDYGEWVNRMDERLGEPTRGVGHELIEWARVLDVGEDPR